MGKLLKVLALVTFVFGIFNGVTFAEEKKAEKYELIVSAIPAGQRPYLVAAKLVELINKESDKVKAVFIEGQHPHIHIKILAERPDLRKKYLFFNNTQTFWESKVGILKLPSSMSIEDVRYISGVHVAAFGLCTLNPDIKTLKDLEGKKVVFDLLPNGSRQVVFSEILKESGVDVNKIEFVFATFPNAVSLMRDGLVDVIYFTASLASDYSWGLVPLLIELSRVRKLYYISFDKEAVMRFKKKSGSFIGVATIPPRALSETQTDPCVSVLNYMGFSVHKDMPDEVVTEVLKIIYKNSDIFQDKSMNGVLMQRELLASLNIPESLYHPAALRFFKEKGIRIGDAMEILSVKVNR